MVQDTVSEEWWNMTTFSIGINPINLTSITVFVTPFLNGTVTNNVTNVYSTNGTFSWPVTGGVNPITDYVNGAPGPSEATKELSGTAVVTGGITMSVASSESMETKSNFDQKLSRGFLRL